MIEHHLLVFGYRTELREPWSYSLTSAVSIKSSPIRVRDLLLFKWSWFLPLLKIDLGQGSAETDTEKRAN